MSRPVQRPRSFQDNHPRSQSNWARQAVRSNPTTWKSARVRSTRRTDLRALCTTHGPRPNVQPSASSDRLGDMVEDPNRLQQLLTSFQALIKPSPPNPARAVPWSASRQSDRHGAHDIRFVEDDWESPEQLGAWGLAGSLGEWYGSCRSSPISQQVGGPRLPILLSGELNLRLERLAMYVSWGSIT